MTEPKTWKELREEKRQKREPRIRYFNPRPFAAQPHLHNIGIQRRIEQNAQATQRDKHLKKEYLLRI